MSLPTAKWLEWRPIEGGHFGVVPVENRVTASDTPPSPDAISVPDDTPEHDWAPGRQWLPDGGPHGMPDTSGGALRLGG